MTADREQLPGAPNSPGGFLRPVTRIFVTAGNWGNINNTTVATGPSGTAPGHLADALARRPPAPRCTASQIEIPTEFLSRGLYAMQKQRRVPRDRGARAVGVTSRLCRPGLAMPGRPARGAGRPCRCAPR